MRSAPPSERRPVVCRRAAGDFEFAEGPLDSYRKTVDISGERYKAGDMTRNDLLKVVLQQLQFESDVSNARLACGLATWPTSRYRCAWRTCELAHSATVQTCRAQRSVTAAESQVGLAKAKRQGRLERDLRLQRLNQSNLGAFYFNIPPCSIRTRAKARTRYLRMWRTRTKSCGAASRWSSCTTRGTSKGPCSHPILLGSRGRRWFFARFPRRGTYPSLNPVELPSGTRVIHDRPRAIAAGGRHAQAGIEAADVF